jgi:hypothetical protein
MSQEMLFEEFREWFVSVPPTEQAVRDFQQLLRLGISEEDAKIWLAAHIWDFENDDFRDALTKSLLTEAVHQAGKQAQANRTPPVRREETKVYRREFSRKDGTTGVWETREPPPRSRREFDETYGRLFEKGGIQLAWPYGFIYKFGKGL